MVHLDSSHFAMMAAQLCISLLLFRGWRSIPPTSLLVKASYIVWLFGITASVLATVAMRDSRFLSVGNVALVVGTVIFAVAAIKGEDLPKRRIAL